MSGEVDPGHASELCDRGLYLQALQISDLQAKDPTSQLLAARLQSHLGAPRRSVATTLRAWLAWPENAEALLRAGRVIAERRGPFAAWEFVRRSRFPEDAPARASLEWLLFRASVASSFHDDGTAQALLARAAEIDGAEVRVALARLPLLQAQDRCEEAAEVALELHARYASHDSALRACGALAEVGRYREARDLLRPVARERECCNVWVQLARLEYEMEEPQAALASLDRAEALSPLMEPPTAAYLASRRSAFSSMLGRHEEAAAFARAVGDPLHERIADRLAAGSPDPRRVLLPVPYVRQHDATCVPATLAALASYWSAEASHVEIVEEICYAGTPAPSERRWATEAGFIVREFTIRWDSATALLDRGIPFSLTHRGPVAGHVQVVAGYDSRRGTLLLRDPSHPFLIEMTGEATSAIAFRGMAMVPSEQAARLEGLELPDAGAWESLATVEAALLDGDRAAAARACEAMTREEPEHTLTAHARLALASADRDRSAMLSALDRLLEHTPGDPGFLLAKIRVTRSLTPRQARLDLLEPVCSRRDAEPALLLALAEELTDDGRRREEVGRLYRLALRRSGAEPWALRGWGAFLWASQEDREEALEVMRLSACLDRKDESSASSYFRAARALGREEEALEFLERRFEDLGRRSAAPAITLFEALAQLERRGRALEVLDRALKLRPDDPPLLVVAAQVLATGGDFDRAASLLAHDSTKVVKNDWLRASARVALLRGDLSKASDAWSELLGREPAALDAVAASASLLALRDGCAAATRYVERVAATWPHDVKLQHLCAEWLAIERLPEVEALARRLTETNPADLWAHRELALCHGRRGEWRQALAQMDVAAHLDPANTETEALRATLLEASGQPEQAAECCRQAVRRRVDTVQAIARLWGLSRTDDERRETLALVRDEMARQRSDGPALEIYAELAAGLLAPDELTGYLREQVARRPDWPVAWCTAIQQLASTGAGSEAGDLAAEAGARFPLSPEIWLVQAQLNGAREDEAAETSCLEEALRVHPGHSPASCHLAARLHGSGESARARSLLHRALALAPFEARNHGTHARLLWAEGEYEACLEEARVALRLSPGYRLARELLVACAQRLARPRVVVELARDLCAREPRNVSLLLWLAELLEGRETLQERIRLAQRAVELEPDSVPARDALALLLVEAGQHKDALAACLVRRFPGSDPFLPARAAWVEAQRGQLARAIEQMESLLARYDDFLWGWEQLAEWKLAASDGLGYLRCAERLAELDPSMPASHARLGHARLSVSDRGGAIVALQRALELKPDYTIAAVFLLDAQIADRDLAGAQNTLIQAQAVAEEPRILARAVILACLRHDESPAFERMGLLLRRCGEDADSLEPALRALHVAWPRKADDLMARIPEMDPIGQAAIAEWAKRRLDAKSWRRAVRDAEATRRPEFVQATVEVVAQSLNDQVKAGAFRRMVRSYRALLSQNTEAWAKVVEGLVRHSLRREGAAWCAGWDRREGLQPWMLWNVSVLLRDAGLEKDLARVHQRALALGEDHTTVMHHAWLAAESALDGSPEFASAYLRSLGRSEEPTLAFVTELTQAVLAGLPGPTDAVPFREVRRRFAHSRRELGRLERRDLRRLYRRCLHRVAAARGGVRAWTWYLAARAVS